MLAIAIFVVPTVSVRAQETNSVQPLIATQNAAQIELQTLLNKMNQFSATFNQEVIDVSGELVHEAKGELSMARPNKLRWHTTYPDETLLVANGEIVWHIDNFVEQVTLLNQKNVVKNNPFVLLTSANPEIWADYEINRLPAIEGVDRYRINTKNLDGQIKTLTLYFSNSQLNKLTLLDQQGQTSHITFSSIMVNYEFAPSTFVATVPTGYAVDDQR